MGWYKEYLQDLADIQAEENTRKFWTIIGAIPGCLGAYGLWMTISDFSQGEYLGFMKGLALFVVMLLPMFICGAKSGGGIGGGIGGIILCLIVTGVLYYCIPTKAETEAKEAEIAAKEAEIAANNAAFRTLRFQLKKFEGRKAKDCVGFWKGDGLIPLQVVKNGKKYTIKYPAADGGEYVEKSGSVEERRICNRETNTCFNVKDLICEDNVQCMIAKGDSAYYFETNAPFSLWGYVRTNKSGFDKEVKKNRNSSSK